MAVVANLSTRELGLRSPFFVAGVLQAFLAIYAIGRLGTRQIEAARESAG
ncbi:MAG: hypothetical protein ACR2ME_04205 [Acidimicrobiia bacterium]